MYLQCCNTYTAQYKQPKYRDLSTNNTRRYFSWILLWHYGLSPPKIKSVCIFLLDTIPVEDYHIKLQHNVRNIVSAEVGTNNIISKTQRNKAQRSFQPLKAQRIFLISEAQRSFRNELFDLVEAQRNSVIAERHFCINLKSNLTSAIEISRYNANAAFFAILGKKECIIC